MIRLLTLLLILVTLGIAASFCVIILDEREQGFRTLLGDAEAGILNPRVILQEPGLYLRSP